MNLAFRAALNMETSKFQQFWVHDIFKTQRTFMVTSGSDDRGSEKLSSGLDTEHVFAWQAREVHGINALPAEEGRPSTTSLLILATLASH